jgi:hypothetical protein
VRKLLLRRRSLTLNDSCVDVAHQVLGVRLHLELPVSMSARLRAVGEDRAEHDLFLSYADKLYLSRAMRMKPLGQAVSPVNEAHDAADSL